MDQFNPTLLGLLETKCSGERADVVCHRLGFDSWVRVEALGYSEGIWILWKDLVTIDIIRTHPSIYPSESIRPR